MAAENFKLEAGRLDGDDTYVFPAWAVREMPLLARAQENGLFQFFLRRHRNRRRTRAKGPTTIGQLCFSPSFRAERMRRDLMQCGIQGSYVAEAIYLDAVRRGLEFGRHFRWLPVLVQAVLAASGPLSQAPQMLVFVVPLLILSEVAYRTSLWTMHWTQGRAAAAAWVRMLGSRAELAEFVVTMEGRSLLLISCYAAGMLLTPILIVPFIGDVVPEMIGAQSRLVVTGMNLGGVLGAVLASLVAARLVRGSCPERDMQALLEVADAAFAARVEEFEDSQDPTPEES